MCRQADSLFKKRLIVGFDFCVQHQCMALEKFMQCPAEDKTVRRLLYHLGLDFERKRMSDKALTVYERILKAGGYRDAKRRVRKLKAVSAPETMVASLDAPVATLAAQIHQESSWRPDAESPYASGLTQFTPDTAAWMSRKFPELLQAQPLNPAWAIRAMVRYDAWLLKYVARHGGATDACERWGFALSGYNGGPGWIPRDKQLAGQSGANPKQWFYHTENYTRRSPAAMRENRHYPRRILGQLQAC